MSTAWDMVKKYREKFGESYPFRWLSNLTDDEHIATIEECLRTGVPIKPEYDPDKDY